MGGYDALNDDGEWVQKEKDLTKAIKKINNSKAKFGDLRFGIFCTAYARENLWESIFECKEDYCYSDTDSCKTLNFERHKEWFDNYNKKKTDNNIEEKYYISSERNTLEFGLDGRFLVIGERINPTGKKQMQEECITLYFALISSSSFSLQLSFS